MYMHTQSNQPPPLCISHTNAFPYGLPQYTRSLWEVWWGELCLSQLPSPILQQHQPPLHRTQNPLSQMALTIIVTYWESVQMVPPLP